MIISQEINLIKQANLSVSNFHLQQLNMLIKNYGKFMLGQGTVIQKSPMAQTNS